MLVKTGVSFPETPVLQPVTTGCRKPFLTKKARNIDPASVWGRSESDASDRVCGFCWSAKGGALFCPECGDTWVLCFDDEPVRASVLCV
ncbi:hypothetical protein GGQ73_000388 [Rhizobium skierniewicense]|uniref:Uncharacterized protein n=1 Tax=Rhizobium skierniewicense TaxID=984260 RepID=A0A7W6G0A7_9HYPH|nr:hypothetical protein [Rhizobium skierniewicense]